MNGFEVMTRTQLIPKNSNEFDAHVSCSPSIVAPSHAKNEMAKNCLEELIRNRGLDPNDYSILVEDGVAKVTIPWNGPERLVQHLDWLRKFDDQINQQCDWPNVYVVSDRKIAEKYQTDNPGTSQISIDGLSIFPLDSEAKKACEIAFKD